MSETAPDIPQNDEERKNVDKLTDVQFDPGFMQKLVDARDKLDDIASQRTSLNAASTAIFASLDTYGLNRNALRAAINYTKMDEEKRENYDLSYLISRKALGVPVQADLFEEKAKAEVRAFERKKKQQATE